VCAQNSVWPIHGTSQSLWSMDTGSNVRFGIFRARPRALVDKVLDRAPLRRMVRTPGRSNGAAPMNAVAATSINNLPEMNLTGK